MHYFKLATPLRVFQKSNLSPIITQVAGYQNPGASDPEISAIANDKLAVARSATTISSNHYKQCNEAVSGINNCLL